MSATFPTLRQAKPFAAPHSSFVFARLLHPGRPCSQPTVAMADGPHLLFRQAVAGGQWQMAFHVLRSLGAGAAFVDTESICRCIAEQRTDLLQLWLQQGGPASLADSEGTTLLHYAAGADSMPCGVLLLQANAAVNASAKARGIPLLVPQV
jgi:hypothetical protein